MLLIERLRQTILAIGQDIQWLKERQWTYIKLNQNQIASSTSFTNVNGLSFSGKAGERYIIELIGAFQVEEIFFTPLQMAIALNLPANSQIIGQGIVPSVNNTVEGFSQIANDSILDNGLANPRDGNTDSSITARWVVQLGADGNVQLTARSQYDNRDVTLIADKTILGYRKLVEFN